MKGECSHQYAAKPTPPIRSFSQCGRDHSKERGFGSSVRALETDHNTRNLVPYSLRRGLCIIPRDFMKKNQGCEAGLNAYNPNTKRLGSFSICRCYCKAFGSAGVESSNSRTVDRCVSNWINQSASGIPFPLCAISRSPTVDKSAIE